MTAEPQFLSVFDLEGPKGNRVPDWLVAVYAKMGTACPEKDDLPTPA